MKVEITREDYEEAQKIVARTSEAKLIVEAFELGQAKTHKRICDVYYDNGDVRFGVDVNDDGDD